jgi:hypothetical protein
MRIIDIRIEVTEDDEFEATWNVAQRAAHGIREDLYPVEFAVEVFDASEEAT